MQSQQNRVEGKFAPIGNEPMADKAVCVRLPQDVDAVVRALGDERSAWLRDVITKAARAELMK